MDERSTAEQPQRRLPWEGLLAGLAGCLLVTLVAAAIVGFYLLPKFQRATANINITAGVTVTPTPPPATPDPPVERPSLPVESPSKAPLPRPAWDASNPAPTDPLLFRQVKRSDGAALFVENQSACPITITIRLTQQNNVVTNPHFPYTVTVAGKQKLRLGEITRYRYRLAWSYRYAYNWQPGSMTAQHDRYAAYSLPYEPGTSHPLTFAGANGYYAYNFAMPEDTPVLAARAGVVVMSERRYDQHGNTSAYFRRVNKVVIRHQDGTLGAYSHLRPGGVVVKLGEAVQPGQLLGYSGNTGFSDSPQLTFCVFKARNGTNLETFSLLFRSEDSPDGALLRAGTSYTATDESD